VIFGFAEDGLLTVYADLAHVQRDCEGIDVESGVYVFYAEDGNWLRPRFVEPNQQGGLGWFRWVHSGRYELEPATPPPGVDPIEVALAECGGIEPNPRFADLEAVRAHIAARRAP